MKFKIVVQMFQDYCSPRKNITFMRHKFFTCKQRDGQSFDEFVTELKKRSAECEFETLRKGLIRDIIICGINNNRLRERLLREPEITLQKTIQIGHAAEETKRHVKELQKEVDGKNSVDAVRRKKLARDEKKNSGKESVGYDKSLIKNCKFCSYSHKRGNCIANGKKCIKCSKFNHFARCFPEKIKSVKNVNCDSSDSDDAPDDTFFVGSVNVDTTETQTNPVISGEERNSTTKKNESNEFTIFTVGSESEIS
jgi:hypothetical protein